MDGIGLWLYMVVIQFPIHTLSDRISGVGLSMIDPITFSIFAQKVITWCLASAFIIFFWKSSIKETLLSVLMAIIFFLTLVILTPPFLGYFPGVIIGALGAIIAFRGINHVSWGDSLLKGVVTIMILYAVSFLFLLTL